LIAIVALMGKVVPWSAMSRILSKWVVLQEHAVEVADTSADGAVTDEAVERWLAGARQAYLDRCEHLHQPGLEVRSRLSAPVPGERLGRPESVVVSATAAEVRPASFTISVRVRPIDGEHEMPLNATWTVTLVDPATGEARELGTEVRDELIALEHAAHEYN